MPDFVRCPQCGEYNSPGPSTCSACGGELRGGDRLNVMSRDIDKATGKPIVRAVTAGAPPVLAEMLPADDPTRLVRVVVTDFDMPIGSMIAFMIKWAIASIPAFLLIFAVFAILIAIFGSALPR